MRPRRLDAVDGAVREWFRDGVRSTQETVPATSLVFGASSEDLASLLSRATSFSCSLGAAMRRVMTSTLSALPDVVLSLIHI